jgi:hypothetical protein
LVDKKTPPPHVPANVVSPLTPKLLICPPSIPVVFTHCAFAGSRIKNAMVKVANPVNNIRFILILPRLSGFANLIIAATQSSFVDATSLEEKTIGGSKQDRGIPI